MNPPQDHSFPAILSQYDSCSRIFGNSSYPVENSILGRRLKPSFGKVALELLIVVVLVHAGAHQSVLLPAGEDHPEAVLLRALSEGQEELPALGRGLLLESFPQHLLVGLPQRPYRHPLGPSIRLDLIGHGNSSQKSTVVVALRFGT